MAYHSHSTRAKLMALLVNRGAEKVFFAVNHAIGVILAALKWAYFFSDETWYPFPIRNARHSGNDIAMIFQETYQPQPVYTVVPN